ncbi:hypothetical protein H5410_059294 [Solanum commersonii]|uniref:Uncharacterized protein n=1 Tax=Solanum commersonii TaxID=4109 RepID=A0A9J5W2G4_SOLCO|nr:hypothetical protein H5410_059294 [Solanum commersonii]
MNIYQERRATERASERGRVASEICQFSLQPNNPGPIYPISEPTLNRQSDIHFSPYLQQQYQTRPQPCFFFLRNATRKLRNPETSANPALLLACRSRIPVVKSSPAHFCLISLPPKREIFY